MAKLLGGDDHAVDIGVENRQEAEEIILKILKTYAEWLAGRFGSGRLDAEGYHKGLVEQFSGNQDEYAYELPLTELRRTGEMSQWTPQPLRVFLFLTSKSIRTGTYPKRSEGDLKEGRNRKQKLLNTSALHSAEVFDRFKQFIGTYR